MSEKYNFKPNDLFDKRILFVFSFFKFLPISFKSLFYQSNIWDDAFTRGAFSTNRYYEYLFYQNLPSASIARSDSRPLFLHLWSENLNTPFLIDNGCKPAIDKLHKVEHRKVATKCFLETVSNWIDWMKQNDVYDNTKIIIVGDHGAASSSEDRVRLAVNPVMMVKDFGEREKLRFSTAMIYNADTASILCSAIGGCAGIQNDVTKTESAERKFIYSASSHGDFSTINSRNTFEIIEN